MGLGLTIVKKVIEGHGWKLTVYSEPDRTIFQIAIPIR